MNGFAPYWMILFPLLGALLQASIGGIARKGLGEKTGKNLMGILAVLHVFLAFGVAVSLLFSKTNQIFTYGEWISIANISIPFEQLIDPLSITLCLVITGIGGLIHLYATGYMYKDQDYTRFFTYMNLFVACMLLLVTANNFLLMFVGWEGVGLCSYLLIGFWYKDLKNTSAANKAFIVNRIGDLGLILAMFAVAPLALKIGATRVLSFDVLLSPALQESLNHPGVPVCIALLFVLGAVGKSAQFPLYIWLPDAMAGPTPVSALIHAATMVTAGVYLLVRCQPLVQAAGPIIAIIGAFTAVWAAIIALSQTDIKKVLAYSTVSQLGYMFLACGLGASFAAIFHLVTHAFFKALLFLCSGSVIYAMNHEQDMRVYGNLKKYLYITSWIMTLGGLCMFFPFTSGFWSKEEILSAANAQPWLMGAGLFVSLLTGIYVMRLIWMTFWVKEESWRHRHPQHDNIHHFKPKVNRDWDENFLLPEQEITEDIHEHLQNNHTPKELAGVMLIVPILLLIPSLGIGFLLAPGFNPAFQKFLSGSLGWHQTTEHADHTQLMLISTVLSAVALAYVSWRYQKGIPIAEKDEKKWGILTRFPYQQWGYDALLSKTFVKLGQNLVLFCFRAFDRRALDGVPSGFGHLAEGLGSVLRSLQTGYVRSYAFWMLIGVVSFMGYLIWAIQQISGGLK